MNNLAHKAIDNFIVGALGTMAVGLVALGFIWVEISILEYFRPMLGIPGALAAFVFIVAICVGLFRFVTTLFTLASPSPELNEPNGE
jgi:TRAP-type C4-dicarboxylate transport system permease small subunit